MKKAILVMCLSLSFNTTFAQTMAREAGKVVGDFVKGMAPTGAGVIGVVTADQLEMASFDAASSTQIVNRISKNTQDDVEFVYAHSYMKNGIRMILDNCTGVCVQKVNEIVVRGGGNITGVASIVVAEGDIEMWNRGGKGNTQIISDIQVGTPVGN